MEIIFKDKHGDDRYKLLKRDPGWELMKWDDGGDIIQMGKFAGKAKKSGWKKMAAGNGVYPSNMEHAVVLIAESQMMDSKSKHINIAANTREVVDYLNQLHAVAARFTTEAAE